MAAVSSSRRMLNTAGGGWGDIPSQCKALWVPRKALFKCNKLLLYILFLYNPQNLKTKLCWDLHILSNRNKSKRCWPCKLFSSTFSTRRKHAINFFSPNLHIQSGSLSNWHSVLPVMTFKNRIVIHKVANGSNLTMQEELLKAQGNSSHQAVTPGGSNLNCSAFFNWQWDKSVRWLL